MTTVNATHQHPRWTCIRKTQHNATLPHVSQQQQQNTIQYNRPTAQHNARTRIRDVLYTEIVRAMATITRSTINRQPSRTCSASRYTHNPYLLTDGKHFLSLKVIYGQTGSEYMAETI